MPPELDGLRIAHLSDLHLGVPSRGRRAVQRRRRLGARAEARPRLHHRRSRLAPLGDAASSNACSASIGRCYVVLGNHDFADSRDPFSQRIDPAAIARLPGVVLLGDEAVDVELRGRRVQVVGVEPQSYAARTAAPERLADEGRRPAPPPLPLPGDRASHPGCLPPRPRGTPPRGSDRRAVPGRQAPACAPTRAGRRGRLRLRRDEAPRLAGPRHDLRSLPALRASGGHGARLYDRRDGGSRHLDRRSRRSATRRECRRRARAVIERRSRHVEPPASDDVTARRPHRRDVSRLASASRRRVEWLGSVARGQSRGGTRARAKRKWIERAEEEWGAWGSVYRDDDGRVLGSMQYGPSSLFPRAADLPAGPPSDDAVLVTCAYLLTDSQPWVEQSLFLAAIGEARDKGARALEAFAYRYREGTRPPSASSSTGPCSRATSSPTSGSRRPLGRPDRARASGLRRSAAGRGGHAREGAERRARGVRARARACAARWRLGASPLAEVARQRAPTSSSAIWIALSAAPLRRLSHTRKRTRPFSAVGSDRIRPTMTSSTPIAWPCAGIFSSRKPGRCREERARLGGDSGVVGLDPDRLGVADDDRNADAASRYRELRELEDLARLLAELDLLVELDAVEVPVHAQRWSSGSSARRSSIALKPAPETDW